MCKINKFDFENMLAMALEENSVYALIELHKGLIGKSLKPYEHLDKTCDAGLYLVGNLLIRDRDKLFAYNYSFSENEFIKSSHLSNYFKTSIKQLLEKNIDERLINVLNNGKDINDMGEEEIKLIKDTLDKFYSSPEYKPVSNVSIHFMTYLYKLDGEGVTSYIKHNIPHRVIAYQFMLTSGLNPRAEYYSGRGVNTGDLNAEHLAMIFNKLCVLDKEYALEFVKMVNDMKTLGATEFIESFYLFASNEFKNLNGANINSNISFGNLDNESGIGIAFGVIMSQKPSSNKYYQTYITERIKAEFMLNIKKKLVEISQGNQKIISRIRQLRRSSSYPFF